MSKYFRGGAMLIELNEELKGRLEAIALLMKTEKRHWVE